MAVVMGTGSFFLALALIVNAVAFMVPYWVEQIDNSFGTVGTGLWGDCTCRWHVSDFKSYWESGSDWFKAVQALYAIGIALIILAVLILMFVSCCREKQGGAGILVVGIFLILAFAVIASAIIVFGVMMNKEEGYGVTGVPRLGWAMWVGVVGSVLVLVAAIMHISWGRRH